MKAARLHQRGGPEQIIVEEAPLPIPTAGEVRIRVRAAALTPGELGWDETYRNPDKSPRIPTIPGHDVAGTIDALGSGVNNLFVNDSVYALVNFPLNGSAAEFVVLPAIDVAHAPRSIDALHAAAVPLSALTAWQALFDQGKLSANQRVLIHGASGGVGAYAIQFARRAGAHVIATASTKNLAAVHALGAHDVIDYTTTRFEQAASNLNVIFDTIGGDTLARSYDTLLKSGILVSIAGVPDLARCKSLGITGIFFIVHPSRPQLEQIAAIIDAGQLRIHIQETFSLSDAHKAFERSMAGHLNGKVILTIP